MNPSCEIFDNRVKLVFSSKGPWHHFFGYYDKSPLDATRRKLLCLRVDFDGRLPEADDYAQVGYWDILSGKYVKLGETRAFNWQQGCMLQWLGPRFDRYIIFNDRRDDRFVSIILDTVTGQTNTIPFPVYSVHPNGSCAISVDFERHYFPRRGYAYAGIIRQEKNANLVEDDGIFFIDFKTKTVQRIISIRQMYERNHLTSMEWGANYLEHLMFSPSGKRFLFLHRWELEDGGIYSRVYTSNICGRDIRCLLDSGKATHYCWRGDKCVLVWGALPNVLNRLRRYQAMVKNIMNPLLPMYHRVVSDRSKLAQNLTSTSYLLVEDCDSPKLKRFAQHKLSFDGHPSWNPNSQNWLVSDTYQDGDYYQWLYLFDAKKNNRFDIGKFYIPPASCNSPTRCDLHPRWDRSGKYICIDSLHNGTRQMYLFDVTACLER